MKQFCLWLICLTLLSSCHAAKDDLQLLQNVERFRLPNGMTFILLPKKGVPIFAAHLRVKVGSMDESIEEHGLAHLFEHMAYKGTAEIDDFYNTLKTNGAVDFNALTSYDFTNYKIMLPLNKLELWAYMESDRLKNGPVFDAFFTEVQVVLSERNKSVDNNPDGMLMETFLNFAFANSPYSHHVIGSNAEISSLTPEKAKSFYEKFYTPSRMVVALVGDLDVSETKKIITKYFGEIPAKPNDYQKITPESSADLPKQKTIIWPAADRFWLGYARAAFPNADDTTFDFLSELLCNGENSLLHKKIVLEMKLAVSINCRASVPGGRLPGYFIISGMPAKAIQNAQVVEAIRKELETLTHEGIPVADMARYKAKLEANFIYSLESYSGMASKLSFYESFAGDWREIYKFRAELLAMDSKMLQRVLKTYFIPSHEVLLMLQQGEVQ